MNTRLTVLAATILAASLLCATNAVAQKPIDEKQQRNKAVDWIKKNNKFGPDHGIVNDMSTHIDEQTQEGFNINLYFGKNLLKSGKFHSVHLWSGQFFQFDVTERQASTMDLGPLGVQTSTGKRQDKRATTPVFQLSELKLQSVKNGQTPGNKKLEGTVKCQLVGEFDESKSYALRMGFRTDVNVMRFHYFDEKPNSDGVTIKFSYDPVNDDDKEKMFQGTLASFFDICTIKEADGNLDISLLSNSVGALIDVKKPE